MSVDLNSSSLPRTSTDPDIAEQTSQDLVVETLSLESGLGFATHSHPQDQLSWMRSGAMTVSVDGVTLWLRRDHLVWIPGHARHDMTIIEGGEVVSLYTSSDLRPVGARWARAHALSSEPLLEATLGHRMDSPLVGTPGRQVVLVRLVLGPPPVQHRIEDQLLIQDQDHPWHIVQHLISLGLALGVPVLHQ